MVSVEWWCCDASVEPFGQTGLGFGFNESAAADLASAISSHSDKPGPPRFAMLPRFQDRHQFHTSLTHILPGNWLYAASLSFWFFFGMQQYHTAWPSIFTQSLYTQSLYTAPHSWPAVSHINSSKRQHHSVTLHCIIISFYSDAQCSFQFHHTDRGTTPTLDQEDTAHPSNWK